MVLYVFRPTCIWCARNEDAFRSLVGQSSDRFDYAALSLPASGVKAYASQHLPPIPTFQEPSSETVRAYRLGTTPETIVIGRDGAVLAHWRGAYRGDTRTEVERFFSVRLPDGTG